MSVTTERFERLVTAATRAPSSHNTQPWRFACDPAHLDVLADRLRALPVNDAFDRELTISCGCALFNPEVEAGALGLAPQVRTFPQDTDSDLLARVLLRETPATAAPYAPLVAAIQQRHTWRGDIQPTAPAAALQARLVEVAVHHGLQLKTLEHGARADAAALVEEGDRMQWADPAWRRELALWMHPRRLGDGLTVPAAAAPVARAVVRATDMGRGVGHRDHEAVVAVPWIGLLSTTTDTPADWLAAGRALQHLLLEAALHGFHAAYYNQPLQVAALRPRPAVLAAAPFPQVLFRLARPDGVPESAPRRPLADVVAPASPGHAPC